MIVVGIVGSPAGGKSTVARHLQALGATWVNADLIAREVLERPEIQTRLLEHFGADIADKSGQIDRQKLATRVFGDDDSSRGALTYLERVIHPATRRLIELRLREAKRAESKNSASEGSTVVILDVPLLFEVGWDFSCDQIWCVDADRTLRLERASGRGWSEGELQRRENNQLDIEEKRRLSSRIIENNGSLEELYETVRTLWRSIQGEQEMFIDDRHC